MKKIVLALLGLAAATTARAQQQPQFTHYAFNGMYLNPAYAGVTQRVEATVIGRYQYYSLTNTQGDANGSPRTGMVSASIPLLGIGGGLGFVGYYDQAGATKLGNFALSYAQHLKLGEDSRLSFGIQGTYTRVGKDTYRALDPSDPNIPANASDGKFDGGAGIWFESPKFYAGLSLNNIFRSQYQFANAIGGTGSQYLSENHSYLTLGYNAEISESVTLTPTALVKAVLPGSYSNSNKFSNSKNYSLDAGLRATFNDQFWIGANYRLDESISGLIGGSFGADNRYRIGAAFDFIAFNQDARAFGSYELFLQLRMPKMIKLGRPAIHNPLYSF